MIERRSYGWLKEVLAWSFSALLFAGGCADSGNSASSQNQLQRRVAIRKAGQPGVLMVGNETVTCDDIMATPMEYNQMFMSLAEFLGPLAQAGSLEQFKVWARPHVEEAVTSRISEILLYQEAKRQAGDEIDKSLEKAVDAEWRRFVLRFGGDEAKAEEALRQQKIDRRRLKEYWRKDILRQSYIASKLPPSRPVTYRELMQCYNDTKDKFFAVPAILKFHLIDIQPAKLQPTDPDQSRLEKARELASDLVKHLRAGEDFGTLAEQHAEASFIDHSSGIRPDSLAKPYDILLAAAEKIQPGEVAGPMEVEGHIFVMKLQENRSKGYEPFEKVQDQLEQKIIADRRKEALDKLAADLLEQTALSEKERFVDFCLETIYRMSKR